MIQYILLYFAFGIPVIVSTFLWGTRGQIIGRIILSLIVWIVWPVIPIVLIRERLMMRRMDTTCAWCGEKVTINPKDKASWVDHALRCQSHPLRPEIERYRLALLEIYDAEQLKDAQVIAFKALKARVEVVSESERL